MAPSEEGKTVLSVITGMYDKISQAEKKIADFILNHIDDAVNSNVSELANHSGVSDATVVRTCQKLGLAGYQELKLTLAQCLVTPQESIHEELHADDSVSAILDKVFQSTERALHFTHDITRPEVLDQAAAMILAAQRVCIYGLAIRTPSPSICSIS